MATLSEARLSDAKTIDDPAEEIARILEEHFDEMGWSEADRDARVARASAKIDAAAALSKPSR